MKLRQLEFAVKLADCLSFSAAAAQCNASQPTLSAAIAELERDLGGKLFSRSTRRVALTPFGRHMMPALKAILSARADAISAAHEFTHPETKLLRIGMSPLVDTTHLTEVTDPFCTTHADVEAVFKECLSDDLADRLKTGNIDIAVLPHSILPEGTQTLEFYHDPLMYLPAHGHEDPSGAPLALSEVPDTPLIGTAGGCGLNPMIDAILSKSGQDHTWYKGYAHSYPVIEDWAWLGLGAGILPRTRLTGAHPLPRPLITSQGAAAQMEVYWVWAREARQIAHIAEFLDYVRKSGQSVRPAAHPRLAV